MLLPSQRRTFNIIALAILPVLLVIGCILLGRATGAATFSNSSKVQATLERYRKTGLFQSSLFETNPGFFWPKHALSFPVGQGLEKVAKAFQDQKSSLSGPNVAELSTREFIQQTGLLFAKGTQFEGKFQVNDVPKSDFINLYILDRDPDRVAKYFTRNCEYIGYYNSIICDSDLFKAYFAFVDAIKRTYDIVRRDAKTGEELPSDAETLAISKILIKESILVWILAHEVGHAVLHKDVLLRDNVPLHFDLEYNRYEQQADSFVADKVISDWPLATNFWLGAGEFAQQEFRRIYRSRAGRNDAAMSQIELQRLCARKQG